MCKVIFIYFCFRSKQIQCQLFLIVIVDITPDHCTLAVGRRIVGHLSHGSAGVAHELHHKDIHVCLTDHLVLQFTILHFTENTLHTVEHLVCGGKRINTVTTFIRSRDRDLQSFNTQYNIF